MEDFTDLMGYGSRVGDFSMDMVDSEMVISDEEN